MASLLAGFIYTTDGTLLNAIHVHKDSVLACVMYIISSGFYSGFIYNTGHAPFLATSKFWWSV